jgi:hypothetical protein
LNFFAKVPVEMTSPQIKKVGAAMTMTPHNHALLAEASRFAERLGASLRKQAERRHGPSQNLAAKSVARCSNCTRRNTSGRGA